LQAHWSEAIRAWAEQQPVMLETHASGSRVKSGYTTDSALDLALMVDGQDEGEQLGNAICLLPVWCAELQELLPVKVHAQSMFVDDIVFCPTRSSR
jgi:hypothetical protein